MKKRYLKFSDEKKAKEQLRRYQEEDLRRRREEEEAEAEEAKEEIQRGCYVIALYYTNGELETFRLPLITDREEAQKFCDLYEQQKQVDKSKLILSANNRRLT